MAKISTLTDDFAGSSLDTDKWGGDFTNRISVDGQLNFLLDNGTNPFSSIDSFESGPYDLEDSSIMVEIKEMPSPVEAGGYRLVLFSAYQTSEDSFTIEIDEGNSGPGKTIKAVKGATDKASETFSINKHRFLRLRHSSGTMYWETSSDGATWDELYSEAISSGLSSREASLYVEAYEDNVDLSVNPTTFKFDNFNIKRGNNMLAAF